MQYSFLDDEVLQLYVFLLGPIKFKFVRLFLDLFYIVNCFSLITCFLLAFIGHFRFRLFFAHLGFWLIFLLLFTFLSGRSIFLRLLLEVFPQVPMPSLNDSVLRSRIINLLSNQPPLSPMLPDCSQQSIIFLGSPLGVLLHGR